MRSISLLLCLFLSICISAQVGVGTTNPQSTLDIEASNPASPTNNDGILIPRVASLVTNPGSARDGMLVFYTGTGEDGKGFYYWNESINDWVKIASGNVTSQDWYEEGTTTSPDNINDNIYTNGRMSIGTNTSNPNYNFTSSSLSGDTSILLGGNSSYTIPGAVIEVTGTGTDALQINLNGAQNASDRYAIEANLTGGLTTKLGFLDGAPANTLSAIRNNITLSGNLYYHNTIANHYTNGTSRQHVGFYNDYLANSSGQFIGLENRITGNGGGNKTGLKNQFNANAGSYLVGHSTEVNASNNTASYIAGVHIEIPSSVTAPTQYGIYSDVTNASAYSGYFLGRVSIGTTTGNNYILPASRGSSGYIMQYTGGMNTAWVDPTTLGIEDHDWYGEGSTAAPNNINDDIYTQGNVAIGKTTADYKLDIQDITTTTQAVNITKTDNSNNETNGLFITKTGNGNGYSHAIYNIVNGSGTGQKYGVFNRINTTANGNQYAIRNWLSGGTSSTQFGVYNNLINDGTGNRYGTYNAMRGSNSNQQRGVHNEFDTAVNAVELTGVRNQLYEGTASDGIQGVYNDIQNASNSNIYGIRTLIQSAANGSGNKYGSYNFINGSAGGTHYGVYSEVTNSSGYAGYFLGRLSVGTATNTKLEVVANGNTVLGGDQYWRDENTGGTILAQMLDDGNDGRFILRENGNISVDLDANTQFVFNEQGLDRDFRIESDTWLNIFRVDAGNNRVGIGTASPDYRFSVNGPANLMEDQGTGPALRVQGDEALWYDGTRFSWGFGGTSNTFADDVGIGMTAVPSFRLDVRDNPSNNYVAQIYNTSTNANVDALKIRIGRTTAPTGSNRFIGFFDGNGGLGTLRGVIEGNGTGVNYNTTSDRRLKTHIKDISKALLLIDKIQPRIYEYKENLGITEYGFIAQELQSIYPQAVTGSPDSDVTKNPMMVDYSRLTPILAAGIKELKKEVDDLKAENAILKAQLNNYKNLEARILALENNNSTKTVANTTKNAKK